MNYDERKGRSAHTAAELDTSKWPTVRLPETVSQKYRDDFDAKKKAVTMYAAGDRTKKITEATRISRQTYIPIFNRCLEINPDDGQIWGFRVLIPYTHLKEYERGGDSDEPGPGSFSRLLKTHPDIDKQLRSAFFDYDDSCLSSNKINDLQYFELFLKICQEVGIKDDEYPFNTLYKGKRSFEKYIRSLRNSEEGINANSDTDATRRLHLGSSADSIDKITRPYKSVAFDGHSVDASWFFYFFDANGRIREQYLERFWLLLILDEHSEAVLGYSISIYENYNRLDVIRAIKNALQPPQGKILPPDYLIVPVPVDVPSIRSDKFRNRLWETFRYDNAKANLAADVVNTLIRIGCRVNAGPVAFPEVRGILERFFQTLEELGFRSLPGSLGTGPNDPKRETAKKDAKTFRVTFEILYYCLELSIEEYNRKLNKRNLYSSPLQCLNNYIDDTDNIVLKIHPDKRDEISRFGPKFLCTVRGNEEEGTRPYVQILNEQYSSQDLGCRWEMLGKQITCYLQENAQYADSYDETGFNIGMLAVKGSAWNFPHTYENRILVSKGRASVVQDLVGHTSPGLIINMGLKNSMTQKKAARVAQAVLAAQAIQGKNQLEVSFGREDEHEKAPISENDVIDSTPINEDEDLEDAYNIKGLIKGGKNEHE